MYNEKISRKEFLEKCLSVSIATTASLYTLNSPKLSAETKGEKLIAIKGGLPDKMFDKGIDELGGLSSFIKKGQTVVVKPNIGWDRPADAAANTNPVLVKRVVEHCLQAGAKKVYVFDNTCNDWKSSYKNSGIEQAAKDAGAVLAPAHSESYYQSVTINNAKRLKKTKVHELILSSDVFVNMPVLKHHSGATMTSAMKNLMGVVWNRFAYHSNDLHQCIADFCLYKKPDLNIVDAYTVMMKNGPRGHNKKDLSVKKMQLISRDIVTIDAAAVKILGKDIGDVRYISIAEELNIGNSDLEKAQTKKISI